MPLMAWVSSWVVCSVLELRWDEEPSREAVALVEFGAPADLELVGAVGGREPQALARLIRRRAVKGRHWSRLGSQQRHRVRPGTVEDSTEDGEFAAAHVQRVPGLVVNVWVAQRPGQHVRIVRAGGLHDRHQTARRKHFDPAVVADFPISADKDCPPGTDRDTGVVRAEPDDLAELVVAQAVPGITKGGIDSEKRFTVGPQTANMDPRVAHWFSITAATAAHRPKPSLTAPRYRREPGTISPSINPPDSRCARRLHLLSQHPAGRQDRWS